MNPVVLFTGRIQGWEHCTDTLDRLGPFRGIVSLNAERPTPSHEAFFHRYGIRSDDVHYEPTPPVDPAIGSRRRFNMNDARTEATWSMFYHRKLAFEKVPVDAECVISFRADITSDDALPTATMKPGVLYVPEGHDHNGLNDQVAYGSYPTMRAYCSVADALHQLVVEQHGEFHPETILLAHVQREGLQIHRFPYTWSLHSSRHL